LDAWLTISRDVWNVIVRMATKGDWYAAHDENIWSWRTVTRISTYFYRLPVIQAYYSLTRCQRMLKDHAFFRQPGSLVCLPSACASPPHVIRVTCAKHEFDGAQTHVTDTWGLNYNYDMLLYANEYACEKRNTHPCMTMNQYQYSKNSNMSFLDTRFVIVLYHPMVHGKYTTYDMISDHIEHVLNTQYPPMTKKNIAMRVLCNVQHMFVHDTPETRQAHRASLILTHDAHIQISSEPVVGMPPLVQITTSCTKRVKRDNPGTQHVDLLDQTNPCKKGRVRVEK